MLAACLPFSILLNVEEAMSISDENTSCDLPLCLRTILIAMPQDFKSKRASFLPNSYHPLTSKLKNISRNYFISPVKEMP